MKTLRYRCRGFSLVEMMVAIGVLSLVILVLFSLFNQTTKAMRANSNQTDVLEASRSGLEILNRELENMTVSGVAGAPNFYTAPNDPQRELFGGSLAGLGVALTPVHYDLFFLQRVDLKRVKVVGFVVRNEDASANRSLFPVGTLYRYEDPVPTGGAPLNPTQGIYANVVPILLSGTNAVTQLTRRVLLRPIRVDSQFKNADLGVVSATAALTNLARVVDGVVSFRVTPYDQFGRPLDSSIMNYPQFNGADPQGLRQPLILLTQDTKNPNWLADVNSSHDDLLIPMMLITEKQGPRANQFFGSVFQGEQVPTTVEFELAVLEPRALEQLRSLPIGPATAGPEGSARDRYLKRNLGKIQIFRQRVPIRVANRP